MLPTTMRLTFDSTVPIAEAEATLRLAQMATENLHGSARTALETNVAVDRDARQFDIDVTHETGRTLALVFAGYARREFGPEMVRVEHLSIATLEGADQ